MLSHTPIDSMINNKYIGSLTYGSVVNSKQTSIYNRWCRMYILVFWLPLSWFQCCDIYFNIKEFCEHWIICWDTQWHEKNINNNNDPISNIDVNTLNKMIARIDTMMMARRCNNYNEDKSGSDDGDVTSTTTDMDDENETNILGFILSQMKETLKIVFPRLMKLNNFICLYNSLHQHGTYVESYSCSVHPNTLCFLNAINN